MLVNIKSSQSKVCATNTALFLVGDSYPKICSGAGDTLTSAVKTRRTSKIVGGGEKFPFSKNIVVGLSAVDCFYFIGSNFTCLHETGLFSFHSLITTTSKSKSASKINHSSDEQHAICYGANLSTTTTTNPIGSAVQRKVHSNIFSFRHPDKALMAAR